MMNKQYLMRAVELTEGNNDRSIIDGLLLYSEIALHLPAGDENELGIMDRALFTARKYSAIDDGQTIHAIAEMIKNIAQRSDEWREAAMETIDEIAMQPSDAAHRVAEVAARSIKVSKITV